MTDEHVDLNGDYVTRRNYLTMQAIIQGAGPLLAAEAVASTAIEHPEWDMAECRTWAEWERHFRAGK